MNNKATTKSESSRNKPTMATAITAQSNNQPEKT
jgi:hypothetical protein